MNKDKLRGRVKIARGALKQAAGKLVGNKMMQIKGMVQKNVGKSQVKLCDLKEQLKQLR
jgi:uncharacterized protein YjbJ (UPF0337 family)